MDLSRPLDALEDLVARLIGSLTEYLPSLLAGILLLLAGWVLARLLQTWSTRLVGGGLAWLTRNDRVRRTMARLGLPQAAPTFIGTVVFWVVFLLFLTAAAEVLGLNVLSLLLSGFATYLPSVLSAVLVLFAGLLAGNLVRGLVSEVANSAGLSYAVLLGRAAQVAVILVAAVTGASQLGIDTGPLTLMVTVTGGALLAGAALAFALGAGPVAGNVIAAHYVQQAYRVGDTVQIGTTTGRIVEITQTAVLIESAEGRVLIPARKFSEEPSVLLPKGE